jgi:histone H1/5
MSDAAGSTTPAIAAVVPVKTPKKKAAGASKTKKPSDHPTYASMIKESIIALKERGGSSRQAILKYILKHNNVGQDEKAVNAHLKVALRSGIKSGLLKQSKGVGASGSFRLGEKKEATVKKPKAKAAAKPKVRKPKAAGSPKKAAGSSKKTKVAGSPKKAKAAGAPKKAKAAGSPKKATKPKPKKAADAKKPKSPKKAATPKATKKPKGAKPKTPKATKPKVAKAAKPKKAAAKK